MHHEGLITLSGRRVLVSGGTAGIGLATVKRLLDLGARVFTFSHTEDKVSAARAEAPGASYGVGDQGDADDMRRVVNEAETALGGLDALVVNAGIGASSVMQMAYPEWHQAVHTNLVGPMHLAQLASPRIQAAGGGHMVFIGSLSAKTRSEGGDVYVATKSGLRGFVDSFGRGVSERGISACLIEPGLVWTEMSKEGHPDAEPEVAASKMLLSEDIAHAIVYVLAQPSRVAIPIVQVRPRMQII